jgi:transposase, IS30 family
MNIVSPDNRCPGGVQNFRCRTVSREVALGGGREVYRAGVAQRRASVASKRPKIPKLVLCGRLAARVESGLKQRWSPAAISARLVVDFATDPEMRVAPETISGSLYLQGKGGLKKELISALRSGRLRRRPRRPAEKARRGCVLGDYTPISQRPPEVADRAVPGHWEGDLIMGAFNRSAIVTVVERQSRFLLLGDLPEGHDAQSVYECLVDITLDLPSLLWKSLTWDQGREMAKWSQKWSQLQIDTDVEVFFCEPHSPWQRPSNENMNGLLRQYFPKGTDLNKIPYAYLQSVAAELNGRPRKVLDWRTPAEVYNHLVATTT